MKNGDLVYLYKGLMVGQEKQPENMDLVIGLFWKGGAEDQVKIGANLFAVPKGAHFGMVEAKHVHYNLGRVSNEKPGLGTVIILTATRFFLEIYGVSVNLSILVEKKPSAVNPLCFDIDDEMTERTLARFVIKNHITEHYMSIKPTEGIVDYYSKIQGMLTFDGRPTAQVGIVPRLISEGLGLISDGLGVRGLHTDRESCTNIGDIYVNPMTQTMNMMINDNPPTFHTIQGPPSIAGSAAGSLNAVRDVFLTLSFAPDNLEQSARYMEHEIRENTPVHVDTREAIFLVIESCLKDLNPREDDIRDLIERMKIARHGNLISREKLIMLIKAKINNEISRMSAQASMAARERVKPLLDYVERLMNEARPYGDSPLQDLQLDPNGEPMVLGSAMETARESLARMTEMLSNNIMSQAAIHEELMGSSPLEVDEPEGNNDSADALSSYLRMGGNFQHLPHRPSIIPTDLT